MNINLLIVDPYYEEIQIAIFKSSRYISIPYNKKYHDIIIKNVMYSTRKNKNDIDFKLKLVTQYPEFIDTRDLEQKDFDDDNSDEEYHQEEVEDEEEEDEEEEESEESD